MSNWTDDRIEKLKVHWQGGLSAAQIALALGGATRNAVIGKAHRLGLSGHAGSPRNTSTRSPKAPRPIGLVRCKPILAVVEPDPFRFADGNVSTMRTIENRMCRWPIGDPMGADFHFCGCAADQGSPYCNAHTQRARQVPRARQPQARPQTHRFA